MPSRDDDDQTFAVKRIAELEAENDKLLLQNGVYRKLLEKLASLSALSKLNVTEEAMALNEEALLLLYPQKPKGECTCDVSINGLHVTGCPQKREGRP